MGVLLVNSTVVSVKAAPMKTVLYFYGNTCPACKEVAPLIERIIDKGVPVEKYEVYENRENADRMVMSFKMYGVPETEWAIPVAFYNGQMYMGIPRIQELEKELTASVDAGAGTIGNVSDTIGMMGIMGAALADSVNPCAILVLVILLSFISLYHKSRRRLILSAASFIFSVFLTYILVGIGIVKALTFLGVSDIVRNFVGMLAIVVGVLNLKDYFAYGAGGFSTEIPQAWRPFLFSLLRKATNPLAAFVMGGVVTLIELPCTGGPYFFALGIMSKWGMSPAFFAYLIVYNLIFISPLVLIATLVYLGKLTVEKTSDWQAQNAKRLHLAAGLLMLAAGIGVLWT
jgi:cytochrome c biogenesis protein CcdA/glutaredoxin